MKATELMIGDWVRIKITQHNTTVTNIDANSVYTEAAFPIRYDEIEPIHITPEILEKNGFIRDGGSWWYQDFRIVLSTSKGVSLVCGRQKRFAFVHELQHALKLCEIEKEVIL